MTESLGRLNCIRLGVVVIVGVLQSCATTSHDLVSEADRKLSNCQISLETIRVQRDECEADLLRSDQAFADLCESTNTEINSRIAEVSDLQQQLSEARWSLSACESQVSKTNQSLDKLRESERALSTRLEKEISERSVEVQMLRDRLAVRVLDKILFSSGSAAILPDGLGVLDKIAAVLRDTYHNIRIEGHTDDVPIGAGLKDRFASNWELSATRAGSIIRYLQHHHSIDPQRLTLVGYSKYQPVTDNDDEQGRQRNRRVEIVLSAPAGN